jgi:hypothetical protein
MNILAGAALGALMLAAAAPAFAGGYWDLRDGTPAPPDAAYDGPPCERACPPPQPPCPPPRRRVYQREAESWQQGPPSAEAANVVVPAEFFDVESSVGPAFLDEGGGGGGGAVETGGFGGAEGFAAASASASASAHVSVNVRVMEMQRRMMRQHQMMQRQWSHQSMSHGMGGGRW